MLNERSSKRVAAIAGRVLATGKYSQADVMILAASVVTQAPDATDESVAPKPASRKAKK